LDRQIYSGICLIIFLKKDKIYSRSIKNL